MSEQHYRLEEVSGSVIGHFTFGELQSRHRDGAIPDDSVIINEESGERLQSPLFFEQHMSLSSGEPDLSPDSATLPTGAACSMSMPPEEAMPVVNWQGVFSVLCGAVGLTLITILQPYAVALGIWGIYRAKLIGKGMIPSVIGLILGSIGVIDTAITFFRDR